MNRRSIALFASLLLVPTACSGPRFPALSSQELARQWDTEHVSPALVPLITPAQVVERLTAVQRATPDLFSLEEIGRSVQGRSIEHLWFGHGPMHVLLWSQMHGDEGSATAALFDVYEHVRRHRGDPAISRMLNALTIDTVPMLNPDGAELFQRRNAQQLDLNRDALLLQSPEGRALKALRDRLNPPIGFNLHNQSWRTSLGRPPRPAAISLLAVAFDEARHDNPGRLRAKRAAAVIRDALEPFASGRIGRYDDEFEVRAFGDNLTKWGTSVVLIETGPWPSAQPDPPLVRLNFIALMSALDALATGRVDEADPSRYETLPRNQSGLFYQIITNASIIVGVGGVGRFSGDIGLVAARGVREVEGAREVVLELRVEDIGDLRVYGSLERIDGTGLTVSPAYDSAAKVGDLVTLPGDSTMSAAPGAPRIEAGEPANLWLLAPVGDRYRVVRVFPAETAIGRGEQ